MDLNDIHGPKFHSSDMLYYNVGHESTNCDANSAFYTWHNIVKCKISKTLFGIFI